jgi:Zn-dependent M28 family amino/carboxypeptidase
VGTVGKSVAVDYKFAEQPAPHPGRNVVAVIPGSDPVLKHEYVAIGAHNDHIGWGQGSVDHDSLRVFNHFALIGGADSPRRPATPEEMTTINATLAELRKTPLAKTPRQDSIYNGADDDGSGTVSVLELAQHFASMKVKPKRSLLFVWHTGEEAGLWGSMWFTDHPTVPRDSIVTQLNIDMIGRGNASDIAGGNPNYLQLIGSRRLSTELGDIIDSVNVKDKHGLVFDYTFDATGHPAQIYCRSDHYSYARYGIPITFFTTGGHPDYHQLTDEPEYIDYDHMARVDSFIADVALHVANLDHRPVVDKPKPDPNGQCVQ